MSPGASSPLKAGDGEVVKFGPPMSGDVMIVVDPRRTGSSFVVGTQTLLPGARILAHRHLSQDEVWFVHKGQGRVTINDRSMTVVPGALIHVPKQSWHTLRNTGTGELKILWASAPPGMEEFLREFAKQSPTVEPSALQALAQRYGMELRLDEPAAPAGTPRAHPRRRRHRGPRRDQRPGQPAREMRAQSTPPPPAATPPPPPSLAAPRPAPEAPLRPPPRERPRPAEHPKEVYMGGRWVTVSGEGPVVSLGPQRPRHRGRRPGRRDRPTG